MTTFLITVPEKNYNVSAYIVEVIFGEWLDQPYLISKQDKWEYIIGVENSSLKKLCFPSSFLKFEDTRWAKKRTNKYWGLKENLNQLTGFSLTANEGTNIEVISDDFLGLLFFLLNRYHEITEDLEIDSHGRVIESETLLVRENHILKPIVDKILKRFCEQIEKKMGVNIYRQQEFKILPSHDVDVPFEYVYYTLPRLFKRCVGDLVMRGSPVEAFRRMGLFFKVKLGDLQADPYNTFDWILDQSEKEGLQSSFHFITQNTNPKYDQAYKLSDLLIESLFKKISDRGHLIALHPSYNSSIMPGQVEQECTRLTNHLKKLGIQQNILKSRYHYLRWNSACINELDNSDVNVDQTAGFARQPGFRCGTARSFRPFNFTTNKTASFVIEPLIVMEVSLFGINYMNLSNNLELAWNIVSELKNNCKEWGGNFTVLWHNNNLIEENWKSFYKSCISK